ncbi:ChaC-like protein [Aquimixticola soesokkakensis]|uniref:glutathione-specific gamma-glutamylcyclotransferase n=1 Tax=Aquimixticola soesokkakensis TaxID=1519096 RepID=A0A1Y5RQS2_9RHOB|nr:gamma-glutamylcyclotransferase [Aquimixticola soesokkakensis]SLN20300.1 ChaC-like protein [Aquimixticola soesokkakensis]
MRPLWVFGYGSLIWNPGFEPVEQVIATATGYARRFCMWSIHHRGTPEAPGLVLALDADIDAACSGVAFRVADADADAVLAALRERELVSSAYFEVNLPLSLSDGRRIDAVTYVVDPEHRQYTGALSLKRQAQIIAQAKGGRGPNCDYLVNTAQALAGMGLHDPELEELVRLVATDTARR